MADTKVSTVIACRVSLEYANALYKHASDMHTTVADIMREGLALVGPPLRDNLVISPVKKHCD
jgi:hypothetical protein